VILTDLSLKKNNSPHLDFFHLVLIIIHMSDSESGNKTSNSMSPQVLDKPEVTTPKMYKVMILNDDYTPMDFVILVLQKFFGLTSELANKIMLDVHHKGSGVAGVYSHEVAEMKVMQVNQFSRSNKHPLKATMETE